MIYNLDGDCMENLYIPLFSLFLSMLLVFLFFSREKVKNKETTIFGYMIIFSLLDCLTTNIILYLCVFHPVNSILVLLNRFYFSWISFWTMCLLIYIVYLVAKENKVYEKVRNIILGVNAALVLFIFALPIHIFNSDNLMYSYGPAANLLYIFAVVYLIVMIFLIVCNFKKIERKKIIPIFVLFGLLIITAVIRVLDPSLVIISAVFAYTNLIMYHTIENPDVKMILKLEEAKIHAEKANRAKSDFLSSMSHEIRTPLNAVVGLSEDLIQNKSINIEQKKDLEDIVNASHTLLEIVGNILDINKIENNSLNIASKPYDLRKCINDVINVNKSRIGEKKIELKVDICEDLPFKLLGDQTHVKTVLTNLVSNAIKYTNEGYINLSVRTINKDNISLLTITCEDTGRGITSEKLNRLFTKFDRLDADMNTTIEGTGLGLAITKQLVNLMNGNINCSSVFGKGSIFVVNLPQKISVMNAPVTIEKKEIEIDYKLYKGKKILVVDDNILNIKVCKRLLEKFEFYIDECFDGNECIDLINEGNKYDLILMDIMMPNLNGEKALNILKENKNFKTPVIALTADALSDSESKYKEVGFFDYLAKPFNKKQIEEKIVRIFK